MSCVSRHLYYDIDEDGDVISNRKGKWVFARMRELMWVYLLDDILTHWRRQPIESKDVIIDILHREFPNPPSFKFKKIHMLAYMNHVLKSRRGMARHAIDEHSTKPPGLSMDDWKRVLEEHRRHPNRWEQQREANHIQQETTQIFQLGNYGKAHFYAKFVS